LSLVQTVDQQGLEQESSPHWPASVAKPVEQHMIGAAGVFAGLVIGLGALLLFSVADDRFTSVTELSLICSEVVGGSRRRSAASQQRVGQWPPQATGSTSCL
jgi:hypothetical protein